MRVGLGYDIHPFESGLPLVLGGVRIPFEKGLEGHSDGDVLLHAIYDAMLGAAGLPDLGTLFPAGDPETKGIDSAKMAPRVLEAVRKKGLRLAQVDTVVIAEVPKLAPHAEAIRASLASVLGLYPSDIGFKMKSPEGLGALGASQGIAAQAVATLNPETGHRLQD